MPQRQRTRDEKTIKIFAENMRKVRLSKSLTMVELSNLMGVEYVQVANLELGKRDPSLSMLMLVANTLGVSISDLLKDQ